MGSSLKNIWDETLGLGENTLQAAWDFTTLDYGSALENSLQAIDNVGDSLNLSIMPDAEMPDPGENNPDASLLDEAGMRGENVETRRRRASKNQFTADSAIAQILGGVQPLGI